MTMENINTGKQLIDATQNAVMEAAENVSTIIAEHQAEASHEIFYQSAEFWVAMAFVVTVLLLSRPIYKAISALTGKYIDTIRNQIDSAEQLQEDAEKLLASYEKKFRNVNKEAESILKKSQNEIDYIRKATLSRIEQETAQREKDALDKLQGSKDKAAQEIAAVASALSVKTVRQILQNKLNDNDRAKLIDASLKKLENM